MRKSNKLITIFVCLTLSCFLCLVVGKLVVKNVLYEKLHMDNEFIAFILQDDGDYKGKTSPYVYVNYEKLYPFNEEQEKVKTSILDKYVAKFKKIQDTITAYTSDSLLFRLDFIKFGYLYENLIHMNNSISLYDVSAVVSLRDGYLTAIENKKDMNEAANSLVDLKNSLAQKDIDMVYVQMPYKISENEISLNKMYHDYSNENADDLLSILSNNQVDILDLREELSKLYEDTLPLFYKTDHHYKVEAALVAAKITASYLNDKYDMKMDEDKLNEDLFKKTIYPSSFLGSRGRRVTLAKTKLEDFVLLTPTYETNMCAVIPDVNLNDCGSFEELLLDKTKLGSEDYYNVSPYHAYAYGDRPIIEISNELVQNDKKILIIRDSFSVPYVPFLSLTTSQIKSLDLRYFTGSVEAYINAYNPDLVIVAYNPSVFVDSKNIEYTTHTGMFDFK